MPVTESPKTERSEKARALQSALAQIEKHYGKEAVMKLGEKNAKAQIDAIPTGALPLDIAIGIGGVPRGRVVEIFGPESSGKTTLCLQIVAQAQKRGGTAAYIDAEHAMDPVYAKKLGVDIDNLLISQPDSGEQALEITEQLVRSSAIDVIVIDSVAAIVPKAELEGEMGQSHMGLQARLMSQALRKLTAVIAKSGTTVIFINQIRQKVGVFYGNPETTPGGLALKFYSSIRLDIRRVEAIKQGDVVVGSRVRVKVVKNKCAPPFRQVQFDMYHGFGISREACILEAGEEAGILSKSGAWFVYKGEKIAQGRENSMAALQTQPKLADEIEAAVRAKVFSNGAAAPEEKKAAAPKSARER